MKTWQSLDIGLTRPTTAGVADRLTIEQQPWSDYVGRLSKADLALGVGGFLEPDRFDSEVLSNCGGADGVFKTVIFVYRQSPNYPYSLRSSAGGELGHRVVEVLEFQESLKCSLREFVEFEYPTIGIVGTPEWIGSVYDRLGNLVTPPNFKVTPTGIEFPFPVYGTIRITYQVNRHRYIYEMSRIEGAVQDPYYSVVYAVTSDGVFPKEIDPPRDFERTDGNCGNSSVRIEPPPKPGEPTVKGENSVERINYCTQEVI